MTNRQSYEKLVEEITAFVAERDWNQYHSPKNLAMALSVEVSEIVEIFQWLTTQESSTAENVDLHHLEEEIGDVMIYLTMLSRKFNLHPIIAAQRKMRKNIKKYPAAEVRGKAAKNIKRNIKR
jgi:NTP pyrophosphatase (non-canonical NTP hydrolase)